jgi:hypothetical protein
MALIVLEPGYEDNNSHHVNVNQQLIKACEQASLTIRILASHSLDLPTKIDELIPDTVISFFNTPCYTNNLKPLDCAQEQMLANKFCTELQQAQNEGLISSSDNLLMHTFYSFHILGLAIWLNKTKCGFKGKILLCAMFYPGRLKIEHQSELDYFKLYTRYRLAFNMLSSVKNDNQVMLATSCKRFVEAYKQCTNLNFKLHPAINFVEPIPVLDDVNSVKHVILYFGSVKRDKGLTWLVDILPELLAEFSDIAFFIHFNEQSPGARNFLSFKTQLEDLSDKFPHLSVCFSALSQLEYESELAKSHALVLMYDPTIYTNKTSGLLWDAVRYPHINLFCSNNSWIDREYLELGGQPITFEYGNTKAFKQCLAAWNQNENVTFVANNYTGAISQSFADWCLSLVR